jgi:murein DD-endopeptidase MepM/ murein hydrolase activator NlpD
MNPAFTRRNAFSAELLEQGRRALREGRRLEARRYFQEAVAANPFDARAWLHLARLSSPVARAFYLVEAFDLNPTSADTLEELRLAYRFVVRLAHPAARPRATAETVAPKAEPAPIAEPAATPANTPSLLTVASGWRARVARELAHEWRAFSADFGALARSALARWPARPAQALRLYTLPGVGLWLLIFVLSAFLITTLSGARGWQRPTPVAVAVGAAQKVTLTPSLTPSATPTPTQTRWPTATPIPSATPTPTPLVPISLRWAPVLAINGWSYDPGACAGPFQGPLGAEAFIWPANNHFLSGKNFNLRYHPGLDIAAHLGDPIYASDSGVVVFAGWSTVGYGRMVVIDHGNGWQTLYAHLSQIKVACGQGVLQGSVIGLAGSTGNSTGPHLHFEMLSDAYGRVNPWSYLP